MGYGRNRDASPGVLYPLWPLAPGGARPRTPQRAFPRLPPSSTPPAAKGGKKPPRPPRAKIPTPGIGVNLASCVTAAGTAEPFTLSLGGRKIFPSRSAYLRNGMYFYTFLHFFFTFLSVSGILYERLKG